MHFLIQACRRKPLESKWLSYSRGATAICMCCLFLVYVGYLISQLYYATPLLVFSSEQMSPDYHAVDAQFCVEKSTLTINNCSYVDSSWDPKPMKKNCSDYFVPGNLHLKEKCYMFMPNDTFEMLTSEQAKKGSIRRFDFYWSIDSLKNVTKIALSAPAISVQLYDPQFNPKRPGTIGDSPKEQQVKLYLGELSQRATNIVNQTSIIYYTPQKYYAIKPRNFRAFLGLTPDYIEINTLKVQQGLWPISDTPPKNSPPRDSYQGQLSISLAQNTIDVQRETRQHTFLAGVALAGGAYGVLTTIYVLLFGMNKLTPWGLIHNTSSMINKVRYSKNEKNLDSNDFYDSGNEKNSKSAIFSWIPTANGIAFGTVLSNLNPMKKTNRRVSSEQRFFDTDEENPKLSEDEQVDLQHRDFSYRKSLSPSTLSNRPISNIEQQNDNAIITKRSTYLPDEDEDEDHDELGSQDFSAALRTEQKRSENLESRVDELELILSQFFIDISYLNELRSKEERKQLIEAKRKSTSAERSA